MQFPSIPRYKRYHGLPAMPLLLLFYGFAAVRLANADDQPASVAVSVTDFLPAGYVADGSVNYQPELQAALNAASDSGRNIVFPPIKYLLEDAVGLHIKSGITLWMDGASFVLS